MLSTIHSAPEAGTSSPAEEELLTDYLLVCEAHCESLTEGSWSFTLESADGSPVFAADDTEMGDLNRLTLLAAIRGLECIEGPASVMLLSSNRYMIRSLSESLPRWRENDFVWEHFGRRIDVQHADLWRRIDRALDIHRVHACLVSSRQVSSGVAFANRNSSSRPQEQRWLRVDSPHLPASTREAATRVDAAPARGASAIGLRRWLLAGGAGKSQSGSKRRFTAADLLE